MSALTLAFQSITVHHLLNYIPQTHAGTHKKQETKKDKLTRDVLELLDLVLPRHHQALLLVDVVVVHQALFGELYV